MMLDIINAARSARSWLFLENRVSDYRQRAVYLRRRAVKNSFIDAAVFFERGIGSRVVDANDISDLAHPDDTRSYLLRGEDGIFFARVEDNTYYPIDTEKPKKDLEQARKYEKMTRSAFARYIYGNVFLYGVDKALFNLEGSFDKLEFLFASTCLRFHILDASLRSYAYTWASPDPSSTGFSALLPDERAS